MDTKLNLHRNNVQNYNIFFENNDACQIFNEPVTLKDALHKIKQKYPLYPDIFEKEISKDSALALQKVKTFLCSGASALVFETFDGRILKLTHGNHFPMNRPIESFDVPVYKKGRIGKVYYYIEEKLYQHGLSDGFTEIVKDMIRHEGYRTSDMYDGATHQIGISKDGRLYLLDPECARYKTIFHALLDKLKKFILKIF